MSGCECKKNIFAFPHKKEAVNWWETLFKIHSLFQGVIFDIPYIYGFTHMYMDANLYIQLLNAKKFYHILITG